MSKHYYEDYVETEGLVSPEHPDDSKKRLFADCRGFINNVYVDRNRAHWIAIIIMVFW